MAVPVAVDLSIGWSVHNSTGGTAGKWVVAPGGVSVTQTANANPTFFVSNTDYLNTTLRTTVRVEDNDNDLFGFVLGYKNSTNNGNDVDFLLLDWRQSAQVLSGSNGQTGFSLNRVNGPIANVVPGFWGHANSPDFTVLQQNLGTGWARNTNYDFTIRYDADRLRIDVAGGAFAAGRTIFDLTGNFSGGGIGFYDYSQPQVRFSNVTLDAQAGIRVPEPGSVALLGLAMCGVLVSRRNATPSRRDSMQMPSFG